MMNMSEPTLSNDNEWQKSCVDISERGAKLLEGHFADTELIVGTEKVSFKVHKLFLSMASSVFEALLSKTENDEPIVISDVDPEVFKAVLRYIYTEDINMDTFDYAHKVYLCATKYLLIQLAQVCSSYMACNITPTTACKAYELGMLYDEKVIQKESLLVISSNIHQVLAHQSFLEADFDTVVRIFSIEDLKIFNELELFEALEKYAKAWPGGFKKRKGLHQTEDSVKKIKLDEDSFTDNDNDEKNEKGDAPGVAGDVKDCNWVLPALQQIRFLTVLPVEFARRAATSPLLGRRLALQLLANISSADTQLRMPVGYSKSREMRNTVEKYGPQLAPPITEPSPEAQYTWELKVATSNNYSQRSESFDAGGRSWEVMMVPRLEDATAGNPDKNYYFGFFVRCMRFEQPPLQCRAKVEFRLLCSAGDDIVKSLEKIFTTSCPNWGFDRFVNIEDVLKSDKGFLAHSCLNLVVRVFVQIEKQPRPPS